MRCDVLVSNCQRVNSTYYCSFCSSELFDIHANSSSSSRRSCDKCGCSSLAAGWDEAELVEQLRHTVQDKTCMPPLMSRDNLN